MPNGLENRFKLLKEQIFALNDPQDRLEYFIELANTCKLDSKELLGCFLVPGCISRLWLVPEYNNGLCYFRCDGDAIIPKGVATAILEVFSGSSVHEILAFDANSIKDLGLVELLGANRRNALSHLVSSVQKFALMIEAEHKKANFTTIAA